MRLQVGGVIIIEEFTQDRKISSMSHIHFRPLRVEDLSGLADLITGMGTADGRYRRLRSSSRDYYEWMYFRNPAGEAVAYGGFIGERLACSFAIVPRRFRVEGTTVLLGKTMDMFTDPEFQGKGYMRDLSRLVFREAEERGLSTLYVTPSKNSYPIFVGKMGFREEFQVDYRIRMLRPSELIRSVTSIPGVPQLGGMALRLWDRFRSGPLPSGSAAGPYRTQEVHRLGQEADELWARCGSYPVIQIRDASYLNWRFMDNPDPYRIFTFHDDSAVRGVLVLKVTIRKGLPCGEVVDMVCPREDEDMVQAMLRFGIGVFRDSGCAMVQSWAIRGSRIQKLLDQVGVRIPRGSMELVLSPGSPWDRIYDGDSWFLMMGDGNDV